MGLFGGKDTQTWREREVSALDWRELEIQIGEAFSALGYTAEVTQPSKDGGRDVDADKIDILKSIIFRPKLTPRRRYLYIDAKQWGEPVGSPPVEKIADVAEREGGRGVIASPSGFWPAAQRAAKKRGVRLYDMEDIVDLFNKAGIKPPERS